MPIDPATLAAFALASLILLVIPGPTIIMVVGQALAHGRTVALASVLGVGLGDLVAASLSLIGVGALLSASATAFVALKWVGALYLVWMGLRMWRSTLSQASNDLDPVATGLPEAGTVRPAHIFRDAFLVTVFNPKGIVFFVAFVPQFLDPGRPYWPQASILVALFVLLAAGNAFLYAQLAVRARDLIRRPSVMRFVVRIGGSCLMGAGIAAALVTRPA
ncbi:putative homoserine/homoserine lactone/threonine efflux protein [Aurantimonas manganoxydans SI85-9A1]|uniref:Putative homoserine/homoserine lactone/threonine efflux protein n=1 Tax=Aurantimonas manganoxydans (strain ATCC BAA-1229 / DSM 21871 / SI85-9A1) TaxID=287752 RepID=Q1YH45_AURMS|nr:LysE family translocator [Aurantimonas manganoxydans]EAS49734.1 putative homoserine/homoserine lactone/threonine efflux protein [Aurantimonas manganoxydans SI85-9A1]